MTNDVRQLSADLTANLSAELEGMAPGDSSPTLCGLSSTRAARPRKIERPDP